MDGSLGGQEDGFLCVLKGIIVAFAQTVAAVTAGEHAVKGTADGAEKLWLGVRLSLYIAVVTDRVCHRSRGMEEWIRRERKTDQNMMTDRKGGSYGDHAILEAAGKETHSGSSWKGVVM